ncbi:MAG: DUF2726 domain-containing protein, partial [Rubrivivax sp.]|nr:DUF2726 domain-containing protein [Rubrivivax sp.]
RQRKQKLPLPTAWTLTARPVFSSEERRVYRQLRDALPHHVVLSKLPLVRFSQPTDPSEVRYWFDLLGASHVSFAICSTNGRVLAAIDLESDRGSSRRSLQIKQSVLSACKVRYLRCTVDKLPSVPELQLLVPQTGPASRGPQAAPAVSEAREHLASTLASKRRERTTLWADSGYLQDSFFGTDGQTEGAIVSGFGSLRGGVSVREVPMTADEAVSVKLELPADAVRH